MKRPKLTAARFVTSAAGAKDLPRSGLAEIAFAGRSNVGKSSLLNELVGRKLARTSGAPGLTRLANYFEVRLDRGPVFHMVDLPGYGYARGAKHGNAFGTLVHEYLFGGTDADTLRPQVAGIFLLVDARHPGLESDLEAWVWLREQGCQVALIATKIDKLSRGERQQALRALSAAHGVHALVTSTLTGEGIDELWKQMLQWLEPRKPREV
jgi:GTP-binding protein